VTTGPLWSFSTISDKASNPAPANGASNVDSVSVDLSWTAGIGATSHDVYFGTTSTPVFIANQTSTVYDLNNSGYDWPDLEDMAGHWLVSCPPADCGGSDMNSDGIVDLEDFTVMAQDWMLAGPVLEIGKTYYWRVDEHNGSGTVTGDLWSFTTMPECMVSHWKLDETSGTAAADSSGNGHTGTLTEGTAGSLVWSAGHIGGALSFDGDGPSNNANPFCRVAVPITGMSVSSGTVALWANIAASGPVNYSSRNNFLYLFGAKGSVTNDRIYISTLSTDLGLDIGIGNVVAGNVVTLTRSNWYHIALTWGSNVYTLYVDGQSVKTGSLTNPAVLSAADIGNKGESTWNQSFHGLMDDVRIYDCVLTAEEIAALAGQ
jgi:hypothetical protein